MNAVAAPVSGGSPERPSEDDAPPKRRLRRGTAALALGALTVLVFLPALRCGFVHLDDPQTVPRYAVILRGLTWEGTRLAFGSQFFGHWVPLTVLSLMADWQLWGRVAYGHHLTSVLLHAANAVLVFLFWRRAAPPASAGSVGPLSPNLRAAVVAALFALHPLRVEPVLWLTGRKDLLATGGTLLALLLYLRWREAPSPGRYLAVTAAFALALLGKATALVAPALMLLLDLWPLGRLAAPDEPWPSGRALLARLRRPLLEKLPWIAMSAAAGVAALVSARASEAMAELAVLTPAQRAATAVVGYMRYLATTVWPHGLAAFYPLPRGGWPVWRVALATGLFLLLTVAAVAAVRRRPWVTVGWFWWVLCLLPVSGLLQAGEQAAADRYTYLAAPGLLMAIVWGVAELTRRARWARRAAFATVVVALVGCAAATRAQIATWRDSETLFRRMLAATADNHFGHLNLANVLAESGRTAEAVSEYRRAIALRPDLALAWTGLGAALRQQGDHAGARAALEQALQRDPRLASAHLQLAAVYEEEGTLGPAAGHLARAISLEPRRPQPWQGMAAILARPGAATQALPFVAAVARSEPESKELQQLLALVRQKAQAEAASR